jgi:branched-chain amino acid transport system permease protein
MSSQLLMNGVIAGSAYALIALGFSLIYRITRFFHFAHAAVYTAAAYLAYALIVQYRAPLWLGLLLLLALTAGLGMLSEVAVYRPLRARHAGPLILLIASLGLYIVLQNLISLAFGDEVRSMRSGAVESVHVIGGGRITSLQLLTIAVSTGLFLAVGLAVRYFRLGTSLRAVANDAELATVAGFDADRCILLVFGIGSALAAVAAILVSFDVDMVPTMGLNALLMGVVATIIGGVGSIIGAGLGGLLLGLAQHLGVWFTGSEWQDAIAFAILLVFLLFRPHGIFGRKLRKAEI